MITREDYLSALELIDQYHRQLNSDVNVNTFSNKTEIESWINSLEYEPSKRLYNVLHKPRYREDEKPFKYVEDINRANFMGLANAGKKTWKEFAELRGIDVDKKLKQ